MRFLITVLISVCLILGTAIAETDQNNVFVVSEVPVEAQAGSATEARRIALDQGRRQAMDILLRRLTSENDWVYLPRLAIGKQAIAGDPFSAGSADDTSADTETSPYQQNYYEYTAKTPVYLDGSQLPALEEGFAVLNEKSSGTFYSAKVTYRFKATDVRELLKGARIPYSESQTRTAMVLPVLQTQSGVYLWESNNPWARAWLARPLLNELTPLVLPRGDAEDIQTISAEQALAFNQVRLQKLAEKYDVTQIIIAHGYLSETDGQYALRVRLFDGYLNTVARVVSTIDPNSSSLLYDDTTGFGEEGSVVRTTAEQPGQVLLEVFYREPVGDFPLLATRAVEGTVAKYAAGWKAQTLIDHTVSKSYRVNAWFSSIDEWAGIQSVLETSPLVASYDTKALTADGATVTMRVVGDVDQLVLALRQNNIVFWTVDEFIWNIATTTTYDLVRDRVRPVSYERRLIEEQQLRESDGSEYPANYQGWQTRGTEDNGTFGQPPQDDIFSPPLQREGQFESVPELFPVEETEESPEESDALDDGLY